MELDEYLFRNRLTVTDMARDLNYARSTLSSVKSKTVKPGKKLAKLIEDYTNGEVSMKELLEIDYK